MLTMTYHDISSFTQKTDSQTNSTACSSIAMTAQTPALIDLPEPKSIVPSSTNPSWLTSPPPPPPPFDVAMAAVSMSPSSSSTFSSLFPPPPPPPTAFSFLLPDSVSSLSQSSTSTSTASSSSSSPSLSSSAAQAAQGSASSWSSSTSSSSSSSSVAKADHPLSPLFYLRHPTRRSSKRPRKQPHELLTENEKKANHIASEQKRRQNIRMGFDCLIDAVPDLDRGNRSEALILQKSIEHIQHLIEIKNQLKNQVRDLQTVLGDQDYEEDSSEDEFTY